MLERNRRKVDWGGKNKLKQGEETAVGEKGKGVCR